MGDTEYWNQRWVDDKTGWKVNERKELPFARNCLALAKHILGDNFPKTDGAPLPDDAVKATLSKALGGRSVFVPLCGDSLVLRFFNDLGCSQVVGVDCSEMALANAMKEQFPEQTFAREECPGAEGVASFNNAEWIKTQTNSAALPKVSLLLGDFFVAMKAFANQGTKFDIIYDRASMVAMERKTTKEYVAALKAVMRRPGVAVPGVTPAAAIGTVMLLSVIERYPGPTQLEDGPPFHIGSDTVRSMYPSDEKFTVTYLQGGLLDEPKAPFEDVQYLVVPEE